MSVIIRWRSSHRRRPGYFVAMDAQWDVRVEADTELEALIELQQAREERQARISYLAYQQPPPDPKWEEADRELFDPEEWALRDVDV